MDRPQAGAPEISMTDKHLSKKQLLEGLKSGWGSFLSVTEKMSSEELNTYIHAQGYKSLKDLLIHVFAWWDETLRVVPILLRGEKPIYDYSGDDEFNQRAIEQYQHMDLKGAKRKFLSSLEAFLNLISNLPEGSLNNQNIYEWIFNGAVEHYEEHRPMNLEKREYER